MTAPTIGVLASGRGTHFATLAEAVDRGDLPARLAVVVVDVADAPVVERARARGVTTRFVDPRRAKGRDGRYSRAKYGRLLADILEEHGVEWVVLAGFMRLLGAPVLERYGGRIVNIHPSLLPAFPGLEPHRQALEAGVKVSGCTVHLVDEGTDTGPILAQRAVPVLDDDDVESLAARILQAEHEIYWPAVRSLVTGAVRVEGRRTFIAGARQAGAQETGALRWDGTEGGGRS